MFGSKTKHYIPEDDTPSLFPEEEEVPIEKAPQKVSEHERRIRQPNALSEIPSDLPRKERIIDVLEEKRQGMTLIGYEESERIAYHTGLYVIHFKRAQYAIRLMRCAVLSQLLLREMFSIRSAVELVMMSLSSSRWLRTRRRMPSLRNARHGCSATMNCRRLQSYLEALYKRTAEALRPLYERMIEQIMQCDILHADETFIKLMIKGTKKCKQAYLWYRLTGVGPPMIAFHFSPSLSRNVAESLLGNYSGTIIRDSYAAYEKLDCEVACCWAHVRRRFPQGVESGYTKAEPPLKIIHALYQIERVVKERAEKKGTETALYQERKNARRQSQKFIREFFEQCRVLNESEQPTSLVAQAVSYALNIEEKLKKFLKDSRLNINNNPAERLNRGIAIIRKKCLFAGSEAGRQRLAILYSFAATCKANRIWFRKWLKNILPRLNSTPAGQIDSLIPEAKLSMSSCSNLFKTLSPIFSFTMGLAGRLRLSVSKCAQNFGHYHAAGQNKRTFKLKLF